MTGGGVRPGVRQRVRFRHVEWVRDRLSDHDREIIATVARLRLVQSGQLERLHFSTLPSSHRARTRRRVLARLVDWRVLLTLERRVGGVRAGSAGYALALDSAGQWLADADNRARGAEPPVRRPTEPSGRLVAHTLATSELYVQLREREHAGTLRLAAFETEPRWTDGAGGLLKPDAYLVLASGGVADHWALEQDLATESLPTIRRKLTAYLDFVRRGQRGSGGVVPRVLVVVPSETRRAAIAGVIAVLPEPANKLFSVAIHEMATAFLCQTLQE